MNSTKRWYELLLHCAIVFLVIVTGTVRISNAYEYLQGDWDGYTDADYTPYYNTSTYYEYALAYSTANEGTGVCTCRAIADAKAKDDYAIADADSYAYLITDWTWNGPPESAPGGDLTWIHDADGDYTGAWGYNTATAISTSEASTSSWSGGTAGSAYADVEVEGSIEDGETVEGDCDWDADPEGEFYVDEEENVIEYDTPPNYVFSVDDWSFSTGDEETIAAGTTLIQFYGGVDCAAFAATINDATTYWSEAHADAKAQIEVDADFDY